MASCRPPSAAAAVPEAVRAMVTVAATTLEHLTEGKAKLVLKFGDNEYDATGGAEAMMLRREYGE